MRYPIDFIIACGIMQVRPEVFLQRFVHEFHYSRLSGGKISTIEHGVSTIMYHHIAPHAERVFRAEKDKTLRMLCKDRLDKVLNAKNINLSTKRMRAQVILRKYREAILGDSGQVTQIGLPGGAVLQLNDSLIMLCFIYQLLPERIIKDVIDNISMARQFAKYGQGHQDKDYYMDVFYRITKGLFQRSEELGQTNYTTYDKMVPLLCDRMQGEPDREIRYSVFKTHFRKWHHSLKHIQIKPIVL